MRPPCSGSRPPLTRHLSSDVYVYVRYETYSNSVSDVKIKLCSYLQAKPLCHLHEVPTQSIDLRQLPLEIEQCSVAHNDMVKNQVSNASIKVLDLVLLSQVII